MAQIFKRKNGYSIRFYLPKDEITGKRERVYLEDFKTEKDAEMAMMEYLVNHKKGYVVNKDISLSEYLERWFRDYAEFSVGARTKRRYAEFINLHIIPALGKLKLCDLKPGYIQAFYTNLMKDTIIDIDAKDNCESNVKKTVKGLSSTTVLHIHRMLHLALKYAVTWQYISFNPCDSVKAPRKSKHEIEFLDDEQIETFLNSVKGEDTFIAQYIATTTGMRLGEVCGLQIGDVNIKDKTFTVTNGFQRVEGAMELGSTKTKSSKRIAPMLPGTEKVIEGYIKQREQWKRENSSIYHESYFFCIHPDGSPLLPDNVSKVFKKYARKLGFPDATFHSLRHSHASWLLRNNVHPKVVSERLGHASVNITLDIYSHLIPNLQEQIIKGLDSKIFLDTANEPDEPQGKNIIDFASRKKSLGTV